MKIGLVTDNTANIPLEELERFGIRVVSLYVHKNDREHKAVDLCPVTFYEELKSEKFYPKTSQPSVKDFEKVYSEMVKEYDHIISVHISAKLSGTVDSAKMAANMVAPDKITIIDSKIASVPLGFLVLDLAEYIRKGAELEKLIEFAQNFDDMHSLFFSVGTLEYLQRGGRIGKAKALMGSVLKLKPILRLGGGEILPVKNVRGDRKLYNEMIELAFSNRDGRKVKRAGVIHAGNLKGASELVKRLKDKNIPEEKITLFYMDVVIGSHLGPYSLGVSIEWE